MNEMRSEDIDYLGCLIKKNKWRKWDERVESYRNFWMDVDY